MFSKKSAWPVLERGSGPPCCLRKRHPTRKMGLGRNDEDHQGGSLDAPLTQCGLDPLACFLREGGLGLGRVRGQPSRYFIPCGILPGWNRCRAGYRSTRDWASDRIG